MHLPAGLLRGIRISSLLVAFFAISGCGSVDWFPEYKKASTNPDQFSFADKTNVAPGVTDTSASITVSGLAADSTTIKITGPDGSNSKYSINGGTATSADGTVKNDDKVTVSHTSSSVLGGTVTSTLSIGTVSGTFTSRTRLISLGDFTVRTTVNGQLQTYAVISSNDSNLHTITISDSNASFSIGDANNNPTTFFNTEQSLTLPNNRRLFVRKPESVSNPTLTIDTVQHPVTFPQ